MAEQNPHEASSSSPSSKHWMYDVFLSFRGKDTRHSFTSRLYSALREAQVNAFIDDNELRRGENISSELLRAIQGSRISVIVFSRRYGDSSWCLEELVKIMECRRTLGQMVFPVFVDVDPSNVRRQTGSFAEAFQKHEGRYVLEKEKVRRWRAALTEAADLSGWDLWNTARGHEGKSIKIIVGEITRHLNNTYLFEAVYPVGIDSRVEDVGKLLGVGLDDVRMVGIWGMGGIGKTTVAKAIYNKFCGSFEGRSFLANVREAKKQPNGQVGLQEQLLFDVLRTTKIKVGTVDGGINVIKERLRCRRVLVIIDDIDHLDDVYAIAGNHDWFGSGSRIVITTRDKHLLKQLKVDSIYSATEMNEEEALQLFTWYAFRKSDPDEGYSELSSRVVAYSGGLPLALEVLGSFLLGRCIPEWESALRKLERVPHGPIQEKLKISFDGLNDDKLKDIFLDVSCFFIGMDKNYVSQILDGCGFFAEIGISVLLERRLVTVCIKNKLMVHDLLRDMGRELVRAKFPGDPGKCSRLWHPTDVTDVLTEHSGTEEVQGLTLSLLESDKTSFSTQAFANMKRLRLLELKFVQLSGGYEHLANTLRWLCWHGFPLRFLPNNFNLPNAVAIDLQYSKLVQVWTESRMLKKLKILNLSHSHYLIQSPEFSNLPNLEKLILQGCKSLSKIHQSIGDLERLALVNLQDCKMLRELPVTFSKLKAIESLTLSGCSKFENLTKDLGEMVSLRTLLADDTAIREIPSSIMQLNNLEYLSVCGLKQPPLKWFLTCFWSHPLPRTCLKFPPLLSGLYALKRLHVRDCNLTEYSLPEDLGSLSCLEELDMGRNCFLSLPCLSGLLQLQDLTLDNCGLTEETITATNLWSLPSLDHLNLSGNSFHSLPNLRGLPKLAFLFLENCSNLHAMPELPTKLSVLRADGCTALQRMPDFSEMLSMQMLQLSDSPRLCDIPGIGNSSHLIVIEMEGCTTISETFKKNLLQRWSYASNFGGVFLPGNDIPLGFKYFNEGGIVSFLVPPNIGSSLKALTVCIVYSCSSKCRESIHSISIYVINHTKHTVYYVRPKSRPKEIISSGVIWQGRFSNRNFSLEGGDDIEICVGIDVGLRFRVEKIGVDLVLDEFTYGEVPMIKSLPYARFRRQHVGAEITPTSRGGGVERQPINFNNRCGLWCLIAAIACSCIYIYFSSSD
ncbi:disease resistance protein RUN1-like [Argentina anserina]|uniref:disease resistance protein RUN1-like n=1 Tax=Argentina anserina TaxID=57926 RepID=UPI00217693F3|nr:disease resistance protein RUN1-like [Potentilla anserina]